MTKNILEAVYGLTDEKTMDSIENIEDKLQGLLKSSTKETNDDKRALDKERRKNKREEQLLRRAKADKENEPIVKKILTDGKDKRNNGLLIGAALIGIAGISAALSDKNVRKKIDESKNNLIEELKKVIKTQSDKLFDKTLKDVTTEINKHLPSDLKIPNNGKGRDPQRNNPMPKPTEEDPMPQASLTKRIAEASNIHKSVSTQRDTYNAYLMQMGGNDAMDTEVRDFYDLNIAVVEEYKGYLIQQQSMQGQLSTYSKLIGDLVEGSQLHDSYTQKIKDLKINIKIKQAQIKVGEEKLKAVAEAERKLKEKEKEANNGRLTRGQRNFVFEGSRFQKGGKTKKRKGNGAPTEDLVVPQGLEIQKRQNGGKVFLHWAGSQYSGASPNYHATIQGDGSVSKTRDYNSFGGGHTYKQNSEGIGISLAAMAGATSTNFGKYPVKKVQYESMAKLTASILKGWGYGPSYVTDKTVPTHAEAGRDLPGDNYGPVPWGGDGSRWDLWKLYEGDSNGSGGPKIRSMIKKYMGSKDTDPPEETQAEVAPPNFNSASQAIQSPFSAFGSDTTMRQGDNAAQTGIKALGNVGIFASELLGGIGNFFKQELMGAETKQAGGFTGGVKPKKSNKPTTKRAPKTSSPSKGRSAPIQPKYDTSSSGGSTTRIVQQTVKPQVKMTRPPVRNTKFTGCQQGGSVAFSSAHQFYRDNMFNSRPVVYVKRAPQAPAIPPMPQSEGIRMPSGGGLNNVGMINEMFTAVGMA